MIDIIVVLWTTGIEGKAILVGVGILILVWLYCCIFVIPKYASNENRRKEILDRMIEDYKNKEGLQ